MYSKGGRWFAVKGEKGVMVFGQKSRYYFKSADGVHVSKTYKALLGIFSTFLVDHNKRYKKYELALFEKRRELFVKEINIEEG